MALGSLKMKSFHIHVPASELPPSYRGIITPYIAMGFTFPRSTWSGVRRVVFQTRGLEESVDLERPDAIVYLMVPGCPFATVNSACAGYHVAVRLPSFHSLALALATEGEQGLSHEFLWLATPNIWRFNNQNSESIACKVRLSE